MSLTDWLNEGRLKSHKTSRDEITQFFAVFEREIHDAGIEAVSTEGRFESAYNASLIMAKAALAASGYRTSGEGNHYWTIQSLVFTIGLDSDMVNTLNAFRHKRNVSNYEMIDMVSQQEMTEMIAMAKSLNNLVKQWFDNNHPELL